MQLYFIHPLTTPPPCLVFLGKDESQHCIKVLRMRAGAKLQLTDGSGNLYSGVIVGEDTKACPVKIETIEKTGSGKPHHLHLAVAPTKNISRFEWLLEKATEIGIDEITPLICFRSERESLRMDRLKAIIQSAALQSLNLYLPILNEPVAFDQFVRISRPGNMFVAYVEEKQPLHLKNLYQPGSDCTILIGPEGDFTKNEIELAAAHHYTPVSLGSLRLRTETAALAAVHTISLLND